MTSKFLTLALVGAMTIGVIPNAVLAAEQSAVSPVTDAYYFKGGIGYSIMQKKDGDTKSMKGPGLQIGIGYNFTNNVRADLSLLYSKNSVKESIDAKRKAKLSIDSLGVLASVYYQFDTGSDLRPYVTLGVGMQRTKAKVSAPKATVGTFESVNDPVLGEISVPVSGDETTIFTKTSFIKGGQVSDADQVASVSSKKKNGFLYKVGAGLSYKINEGVFLDLEYNLSNKKIPTSPSKQNEGYATKINTDGTAAADSKKVFRGGKVKDRLTHSVLAGIRITF